ncbi:hypothetical protein GKODMF_01665 [Candidatus Electrothrix gigas]
MKFSIVDGERVMPFPKGFSRYVVMKLLSVVAKKNMALGASSWKIM